MSLANSSIHAVMKFFVTYEAPEAVKEFAKVAETCPIYIAMDELLNPVADKKLVLCVCIIPA